MNIMASHKNEVKVRTEQSVWNLPRVIPEDHHKLRGQHEVENGHGENNNENHVDNEPNRTTSGKPKRKWNHQLQVKN